MLTVTTNLLDDDLEVTVHSAPLLRVADLILRTSLGRSKGVLPAQQWNTDACSGLLSKAKLR